MTLRSFQKTDIPTLTRYCNDIRVAQNLLLTPFPYTEKDAQDWLEMVAEATAKGERTSFALTITQTGEHIGNMGLRLTPQHKRAELGYWIGPPHWGKGYATEAGRAVLRYGFEVLGCERIGASYFHWNQASGRVLEKLGMKPEGVRRRFVVRLGQVADDVLMGILREEWEQGRGEEVAR